MAQHSSNSGCAATPTITTAHAHTFVVRFDDRRDGAVPSSRSREQQTQRRNKATHRHLQFAAGPAGGLSSLTGLLIVRRPSYS